MITDKVGYSEYWKNKDKCGVCGVGLDDFGNCDDLNHNLEGER